MPQYIDNNQLPIFYQDQPITKEQLDQLKNVFQEAFNNLYRVVIEDQAPDIQRIQTIVDSTQSLIISKLNQFDIAEAQITQITANLQSLLRQFSAIATSKANVTDLNTLYSDFEALETRFNGLADSIATDEVLLSNFSLRWEADAGTFAIRALTNEGYEPFAYFINKTLFVNVVADEQITGGRIVEYTGVDGTLGKDYRAKLADATAVDFDPKRIIGISVATIEQGQTGRVLIQGYLQGQVPYDLRDEGWLAGRLLFLDPETTTGEATWATEANLETRIPRGKIRYRVGTVINSNNVQEALTYVQLDYAKALEEAYNVDPTDLAVNDMLILRQTQLGDLAWERIPLEDLTTKAELEDHEDNQGYNITNPNRYHYPVEDSRVVIFTVNSDYQGRPLNVSFGTLDELEEQFPTGDPLSPTTIYRLKGNLKFYQYDNAWVEITDYRIASQENALYSVTELLRRFEQKADRATLRQDFDLETKYNLRTQGRSMVHWGNLINIPNLADSAWRSPIADYTLLPETDEINPVNVGDVIFVGADEEGKPAFYMCISSIQDGDSTTEWDQFAQLDWDNNHNTLQNLTNQDDHTQYLLRDDATTGAHQGLAGTLFFNDNQALDMVVHKSADNIGIAQVEGKLWFSTTENRLYIYSGSVNGWVPIQGAGAIIEEFEVDATEGQTVFDVGQNNTTFYEVGVRIMQVYRKVGAHYVLLDKDDFEETDSKTITLTSAYVTANPVLAPDHFYFRWANNVGGVESTILDGSVTFAKLAQPMKELVVPGADPLNEDNPSSTYVKRKDGTWVPAVDFDHNHEIVRKHSFVFPSTGWQPIDDGAEPVPTILFYQNSFTLPSEIPLSNNDYYAIRLVPTDNAQAAALQSYGLYNDVEILSSDPVILRFRSEQEFDLANVQAELEIVYQEAGVSQVTGAFSALLIDATQVEYNDGITQLGNASSLQLAIERLRELIGNAGDIGGNTYFVSIDGSDANDGSLNNPFRTIKHACSVIAALPLNPPPFPGGPQAAQLASIRIASGSYLEQLPIVVPANVALVGNDLRTVQVRPAAGLSDDGVTPNNQSTIFQMSTGTLATGLALYGMTGWVKPAGVEDNPELTTAKGIGFALNPASPIFGSSPYILDCSFFGISTQFAPHTGIGTYVDGSIHTVTHINQSVAAGQTVYNAEEQRWEASDLPIGHPIGNRSMLFYAYTNVIDQGVGFWADNGGVIESVSNFTYYARYGYLATRGGYIRGLNGSNSWGTWALYARGYLPNEVPVTGTLKGTMLEFSNLTAAFQIGDTITGGTSGAIATVLNVQESTASLFIDRTSTATFVDGEIITSATGTANVLGSEFGQKGALLVVTGLASEPEIRTAVSIDNDPITYIIASVSGTYVDASSVMFLTLANNKPDSSPANTAIQLRKRYSQIRVTGHDFLNVGSGGIADIAGGLNEGTLINPAQAPVQSQQVGEFDTGRVFSVSTDQDGNFRVGKFFAIDQGTGRATLDASAFDLSGLTSLRLGSIGAQLGEAINEFSSDVLLSQNSNEKVPTQFAIKTYTDTKFLSNVSFKTVFNVLILSDPEEWNEELDGSYTQTLEIVGLTNEDSPFIDLDLANVDFEDVEDISKAWINVYRVVSDTDELTFYFKDLPEVNIPIKVRR